MSLLATLDNTNQARMYVNHRLLATNRLKLRAPYMPHKLSSFLVVENYQLLSDTSVMEAAVTHTLSKNQAASSQATRVPHQIDIFTRPYATQTNR